MYQLVFRGECTPQTDEATARANAMALFKATVDQVDRMFSGQRVVIRNKLDEAQAGKYEAVLRKHGMIAHIEPMEGTAPPPRAASPAPPHLRAALRSLSSRATGFRWPAKRLMPFSRVLLYVWSRLTTA